ncbi:MAG: hypothetical protein AAB472_01640 [Patescibacteria group bacterium]
MTDQTPHLELPSEVIYSNHWTDFRNKDIGALFECIPAEELAKFEPGATIWVDSEHPNGKVYGYDRAELTSVSDRGTHVSIGYKGPHITGGASVPKKKGWHKINRCTDPTRLVELIKQFPLAIEGGTVGTISDATRAHLKSVGSRIVAA